MRLQAREELGHAMRLYDYLLERGARLELRAIEAPPLEFGSPLSIAEQALEHERQVLKSINRIYELAHKEGDYATQVQLQWFVTEQVEEEHSAETMADRLRMAGDKPCGVTDPRPRGRRPARSGVAAAHQWRRFA